MGLGDLMDAERQLGIDPPKRKQPTTPSTPAPQGEKCAHAPMRDNAEMGEIPEDLTAVRRHAEADAAGGYNPYATYCVKLIDTLASERESRKQAEAAQFNAGWNKAIEAAAKYCNEDYRVNPSEMRLRLSKPVQEPAERERGK